ncbi:hypothetical protein MXD62_10930 [Frankia sp. Mgl5]|uniref:hypothetical protein n=1 Tax=Frankia sp. Mgl5 TaxID=2933793 RepID=UPI00200DEE41|nr:hypothetical protein [Frankia sp. Mgl5]MCK9927677.1 hypothetical protein [Frankia sp. Mgl5]
MFAGDVQRATTDLMWAGQRPSDVRTLQEPSGASHIAMIVQPAATADLIRRATL